MAKRTNKYRITLEQVSLGKEDVVLQSPMQLEFENHDEIFRIIEILKKKIHLRTKVSPQNLHSA